MHEPRRANLAASNSASRSPWARYGLVILIVAVVLAIVLPRVIFERQHRGEGLLPAPLRSYAAAQEVYRRFGYAEVNGLPAGSYCPSFRFLGGSAAHRDETGEPIDLIHDKLADAALPQGYGGYFYVDATENLEGASLDGDSFGLFAHATSYGVSARYSFCIFTEGRVFVADPGAQVEPGVAQPDSCRGRWRPID